MSRRNTTEVLVIGAGPVGLMAAVMLAERGVPFQIMDQEWRSGLHNRALVLHSASLGILKELGLVEEVLAESRRIESIGLYNGLERRVHIRLSDLASGFPFIAVLPQSFLESILLERLVSKGVRVQWNRRVSGLQMGEAAVTVKVEELNQESAGYPIASSVSYIERTTEIDAGFVIGTDGYNSVVRRALGIPFEPTGPAEWFAASEFVAGEDPGNEARIFLTGPAVSVLWPIRGHRCRGLFEIQPEVLANEAQQRLQLSLRIGSHHYPYLSEKMIRELLEDRAGNLAGQITEFIWSIGVRFEHRLAGSFGRGGRGSPATPLT